MGNDDPGGGDFDLEETDTSQYRIYNDGRMLRRDRDGTWHDVTGEPPPARSEPPPRPTDPWDAIPPAQQILLKIVRDHADRSTVATERLGNELPDKVAVMGQEIAKELRTGLRNQAIAFFFAMIVLIVAVVTLAGRNMEVRASTRGVEAATGP